jgi:MFS family permease
MNAPAAPPPAVTPMPKGIRYAYLFDMFNAASWTVVLSSPMLLFLQHLHASATVLALSGGMAALLTTLQIPAARFVERVGYKRFVLSGWTLRTFIQVGMAIVTFLPESVDRTLRIGIMLFLSFVFCAIRGISSCGLLPWFTHIVPDDRRGEFLSRDQMGQACAIIVSLLAYGLFFRGNLAWYSFGVVFVASVFFAIVSLQFLRRIPDVPVEHVTTNANPMPWREMFFYPPFFKYIRYNIVINMALGASGIFWIRFFRTSLHVSNANVLLVNCASMTVTAGMLFLIAPVIDRFGNRQALLLSGLFLVVHFTGWACVAAGLLPFTLTILAVQTLTSGCGTALWNLANVRCIMGIVPVMGRPHFLALYSVASSLTVAIVPLLWGRVVDGLEGWHAAWGFWNWNCYSVFYVVLACTIVAGLLLLRFVPDTKSMRWDDFMRALLVETPSRAISRLIGRWRGPNPG